MLYDALVEQAETGMEVSEFGVEFGRICTRFLNSLGEEGLCESLGYN